jgi:hypothetical protein
MRKLVLLFPILALAVFGARSLAESGHTAAAKSGTDRRIEAIAMRFARQMGDRSPVEIAYVATRHRAAMAADSGDIGEDDVPVYLVAVRGRFVDHLASTPPGAPAPRGSVLTLTLGRSDFGVLDLGISHHWPKLAGLGPVRVLPKAAAATP